MIGITRKEIEIESKEARFEVRNCSTINKRITIDLYHESFVQNTIE